MGVTAAVVGASGYAGGELLRLLVAHPSIELGPLVAGTSAGRELTELHPNLRSLAGRTLLSFDSAELASVDVVFLALPHGESAAIAAQLPDRAKVIDLGADYRLRDAARWAASYGTTYAGAWPYGLPELPGARARIAAASRVANPGCYPTAVALGLAPLLAAGLVEAADIVIVAASGTSGAGRSAKASLLGSEVMGDLTAYKVGGAHQHIPEIEQTLGATVSFTPVLAPMPRGILATCTARLADRTTPTQALREVLAAHYGGEPFVHLLPADAWPHTAATLGSNAAHLQVAADTRVGRAIVVVAIDNLGKGAAGQAVQNANLMLGLPETSGLSADGIAP